MNKQQNAIGESWAHLITEHLDTEEMVLTELDGFVAYATIHRWGSQLFKNKLIQTCLGWNKLSIWPLQFMAAQYINSTQSPNITKDTVSNLLAISIQQTAMFLHNKIPQYHFCMILTRKKKSSLMGYTADFDRQPWIKAISILMHREFYIITNPRQWSTIKRFWCHNVSGVFTSIQSVTSNICVQSSDTCSLPAQHHEFMFFSSWSCSCWRFWTAMIKCKVNKTNSCGPCYSLQMMYWIFLKLLKLLSKLYKKHCWHLDSHATLCNSSWCVVSCLLKGIMTIITCLFSCL